MAPWSIRCYCSDPLSIGNVDVLHYQIWLNFYYHLCKAVSVFFALHLISVDSDICNTESYCVLSRSTLCEYWDQTHTYTRKNECTYIFTTCTLSHMYNTHKHMQHFLLRCGQLKLYYILFSSTPVTNVYNI